MNHGIVIKEDHLHDYSEDHSTVSHYKDIIEDGADISKPKGTTNRQEKIKVRTSSNQNNSMKDPKIAKNYNKTITAPSKSLSCILNEKDIDIMAVEDNVPIVNPTITPVINNNNNAASNADTALANNSQLLPDEAIDWFSGSTDIGLDFVQPWTEMLEQRYLQYGNMDLDTLDFNSEDIYHCSCGELEKTGSS